VRSRRKKRREEKNPKGLARKEGVKVSRRDRSNPPPNNTKTSQKQGGEDNSNKKTSKIKRSTETEKKGARGGKLQPGVRALSERGDDRFRFRHARHSKSKKIVELFYHGEGSPAFISTTARLVRIPKGFMYFFANLDVPSVWSRGNSRLQKHHQWVRRPVKLNALRRPNPWRFTSPTTKEGRSGSWKEQRLLPTSN